MTIVTATVTKKMNSFWYGRGLVTHVNLENGIVFMTMQTGRMKGRVGGFNIQGLRFKIERRKEERS
jgi:hypothetical protein